MDLIKIVNTGDKPLVLHHDLKGNVSIAPGKSRVLQFEYASIHFGHPAAVNQGRDRLRDVEFSNARTMWGFYPGLMPEEEWETTFKPQFECYDMEDNRVYMVLDDPDGSLAAEFGGVPSDAASDAVEAAAVDARIAALQAQIDALSNALSVQNAMGGPVTHPGAPSPGDDSLAGQGEPSGDGPEGDSTPGDADAGAGAAETQESRNEARDAIPEPPPDAPDTVADKPRATRVGPRGGTSTSRSRSKGK
jgi:hypothetical protein